MANPSEHQEVKTPKVFISYAQSDEQTPWIPEICERLTHDGVEVVADLYELPHGADIHAFMERCVNDPSITHVLMFCDRLYCEKANQRRGGVATNYSFCRCYFVLFGQHAVVRSPPVDKPPSPRIKSSKRTCPRI
jgi:hypothetical protein